SGDRSVVVSLRETKIPCAVCHCSEPNPLSKAAQRTTFPSSAWPTSLHGSRRWSVDWVCWADAVSNRGTHRISRGEVPTRDAYTRRDMVHSTTPSGETLAIPKGTTKG